MTSQPTVFIGKIFFSDRLEIFSANNLGTLGQMIGEYIQANGTADLPIKIEFSEQK